MVSELTKVKYAFYVLFFMAILAFLSGCDPYAESYPFLTESKWICEDPNFILTYTKGDNGVISSEEHLEWDEQTWEVDLDFHASSYCVNPENSTAYEERLFSGTWEYRNGNLVLIIEEDLFFDNKYSELIFKRADLR